jgi:hypothetical protein
MLVIGGLLPDPHPHQLGDRDPGTHELKGIPGEWRLYAVAQDH